MNKVNPDKCYILLKNCVVFPGDTGSGSQKTASEVTSTFIKLIT